MNIDQILASLPPHERRLREFITDNLQGKCRILSDGDKCECALCAFDRMRSENIQLRAELDKKIDMEFLAKPLNCPFCGEVGREYDKTDADGSTTYVRCPGCGVDVLKCEWQERPIETALRKENAIIQKQNDRVLTPMDPICLSNYDTLKKKLDEATKALRHIKDWTSRRKYEATERVASDVQALCTSTLSSIEKGGQK